MNFDKDTVEYGIRVFETVGFPCIVAGWFMFRTDGRLDRVKDAIDALKEEVRKL